MDRQLTIIRIALVLHLFLLFRCIVGEVNSYDCPEGCPEGWACVQGECVDPEASCEGVTCDPGETCVDGRCQAGEPCGSIICNPGETCVDGRCLADDPCEGVTCDSDEVCRGGRCVPANVDNDHDGYAAATDCNDEDPMIHPGQPEVCDGLDQNCNGEVDEGFDSDRDGYTTCGSGDASRADCRDDDPNVHPGADELCNGADEDCDGDVDEDIPTETCSTTCGEGVRSCVDGDWECSAPENCDCAPGEEDTEECGLCGTRRRTCNSDYTWGDWGSCEGTGECEPGRIQNEGCERCGQRTRTCGDDCRWGGWSGCEDMGECSPGQTQDGGCDRCSQRVCSDRCRWSPCQLRPGSECEHRGGSNYRCCGVYHWQFCLPSCEWSPDCAECPYHDCCPEG